MEILIYTLLFLVFAYIFRVELQNKLTFNPVPKAPLVPQGTFHSILFNNPRDQAMEKCLKLVPDSRDLGFYVTQLFFNPIIFILDEKLARKVLRNIKDFPKSTMDKMMKFVFGTGVFFSNKKTWKTHRHMLASAFTQSRFADLMVDSFNELESVWKAQISNEKGSSVVPVFEWADRAVFQTMGLFSFNKNTKSIETRESNLYDFYAKMMEKLVTPTILLHFLGLNPKTVKHFPYYSEFYAFIKRLKNEFLKIINERRDELIRMNDADRKEQRDVLARILLSPKRQPDYDDIAIMYDMLSLFVAGHETIAITIANTLYYLAKYPVYQKLVQQEARLFYERRGDSITGISLSDLEKELPVLHRVILEVWRLMPPGSVTISRAVASDDANFNGVKIPRGTVVFVSIYDVHRCEKTWGPDAAEFIPERFCIDRKLENELNEMPEKLLTFGYGPHSCLGTLFGTVEGFVGVSKLASKFWFEIPDGSPDSVRIITKKMFAIMSPANLQLKISKHDKYIYMVPHKGNSELAPMLGSSGNLDEVAADNSQSPRLVISHMILENFKSYYGKHTIGPFHKSFTSIVGPNGSGKSNVIDAFMFVLGFRAKKMRQGKLAELIHNSAGAMDVESCTVEVHFHQITESAINEEDYKVVPGSQLIVSRTVYRNSRNVYTVNDQQQSFAEVSKLLQGHGIDLEHNRFLILQGEVESIAQMKPKAANEHEEGLLEYLEDIIGTSDYVQKIDEAGKVIEEIEEVYADKALRVRAAQKECESLVNDKEIAEAFLKQENKLAELKSQKYQALQYKCTKDLTGLDERLKQNKAKLEAERDNFESENKQIQSLENQIEIKTAEIKKEQKAFDQHKKIVSYLEQEDVRLQETRKHLKAKLKNLGKSLADTQKQRNELVRCLENTNFEIEGLEKQQIALNQSLNHEETELDRICKSLQGVTGKYQKELETKQALLAPLNEKVRSEQQVLEIAKSSQDMLKSKEASSTIELSQITERLEEIENEIKLAGEDKERIEEQLEDVETSMSKIADEIEKNKEQYSQLSKEIEKLVATLAEARDSLSQASTGGSILQALMKEKRSGRIPGIHGRLGDLGTIDPKFDTAISTSAAGFLNHIVVDSTETGQRCIEMIRKSNLGRANFIILDKMRPAQPGSGSLPNGAWRLFDLVKIKDTRTYGNAFYFALGETLVAENIELASKLAYGSSRRRVVTLDGRLIETSGTISGGGRPQRGGMKASFVSEVTPEQVEQLESCLSERRQVQRQLQHTIVQLEGQYQCLLNDLSKLQAQQLKVDANLASLPEEQKELEGQVKDLKEQSKGLSSSEKTKLKELEKAIEESNRKIQSIRTEMMPIEGEIAAIQAKILDAGGIKYKSQKSKVEGLKEQASHIYNRIKKLKDEANKYESSLRALEDGAGPKADSQNLEEELNSIEERLNKQTAVALDTKQTGEKLQYSLEVLKDELEILTKNLKEIEKTRSKFKKIEFELRVSIEKDEDSLAETRRILHGCQEELGRLRLHHIDLQAPPPVLTIYEDEQDLEDFIKNRPQYDAQIHALQERIDNSRPNLKVLDEYRLKEANLNTAQEELAQIEAERMAKRNHFDDLRVERHEKFMTGFRSISMKLKEMYQLITMGGNAELELVDSLDPFSEGILFSVMPPKKSWKPISNLSGGEKTLSSLALVFALHTYRPTPIYVMDEIDAALDFRNVSIVAGLIKERTKGAQFIVISLRNNMFELADRLVGIYKTDQKTKSVTIDPRAFELAVQ